MLPLDSEKRSRAKYGKVVQSRCAGEAIRLAANDWTAKVTAEIRHVMIPRLSVALIWFRFM